VVEFGAVVVEFTGAIVAPSGLCYRMVRLEAELVLRDLSAAVALVRAAL